MLQTVFWHNKKAFMKSVKFPVLLLKIPVCRGDRESDNSVKNAGRTVGCDVCSLPLNKALSGFSFRKVNNTMTVFTLNIPAQKSLFIPFMSDDIACRYQYCHADVRIWIFITQRVKLLITAIQKTVIESFSKSVLSPVLTQCDLLGYFSNLD